MSIENEPPVGQHEWGKDYFGVSGQCSRCGARASLAANSPCIWRPVGDERRQTSIGSATNFAQAATGLPGGGHSGYVHGGDRPKSDWRQRISRAGMHLRAALRHLGYCLSDLVGWQREPIAVELEPDRPEGQHPVTLCKCECGGDAPPEFHAKGCLWAAVMCRHCAGLGQCPTCCGDGISPDPDGDSSPPRFDHDCRVWDATGNPWLTTEAKVAALWANLKSDSPEDALGHLFDLLHRLKAHPAIARVLQGDDTTAAAEAIWGKDPQPEPPSEVGR